MRKYKTIIFDFDGTIADSLKVMIQIYNELAKKYKGKPITEKDIEVLRSKKPSEIISYLKISVIKIPFYLYKGRILFKEFVTALNFIEGMEDILNELSKHYELGIITSNAKENVDDFLHKHNMNIFDFVHSEKNIFGKDKALKNVMKANGIDPKTTLYVGDEIRDVTSSHKAGIDVIAVCWGYNSMDVLKSEHPTYLAETPQDLRFLLL